MTENKDVKTAVQAGLSDHQIRELPRGSLRHLDTAQLPPDDGEAVGRRNPIPPTDSGEDP